VVQRDTGETLIIPTDQRVGDLPGLIDSVQQDFQELEVLTDIALSDFELNAIDDMERLIDTEEDPQRRRVKARHCVETIADIVAQFGAAAIESLVPTTSGNRLTNGDHVCVGLNVYYPGADLGAAGRFRERAMDTNPLWTFEYRIDRNELPGLPENGFQPLYWYRGRSWPAGQVYGELGPYPPGPGFVYTYAAGCSGATRTGFDCDEFPNATMAQGARLMTNNVVESYVIPDPQPALAYITRAENRAEGDKVGAFYQNDSRRGCNITPYPPAAPPPGDPDDWFLVIPTADLAEGAGQTTWQCAQE